MEMISNLPVILAALFAIIAGLHGYLNRLPNTQVYWNMTLFLVVFYFIGVLLRRTIKGIVDENTEKAENIPVTEQLLYAEDLFGTGEQDEADDGVGDGNDEGESVGEEGDSADDGGEEKEDGKEDSFGSDTAVGDAGQLEE